MQDFVESKWDPLDRQETDELFGHICAQISHLQFSRFKTPPGKLDVHPEIVQCWRGRSHDLPKILSCPERGNSFGMNLMEVQGTSTARGTTTGVQMSEPSATNAVFPLHSREPSDPTQLNKRAGES